MDSEKPPSLSVTVLNYNYGRYLPQCLDSILAQSFKDFEVIVIDDCSTDDPLKVVQPYLSDPRVKLVVHERNQGVQASLIEGAEVHSRGEFLTLISADDVVLDSNAFETQIGRLTSTEDAVVCFSAIRLLYHDGVEAEHHSLPADAVLESNEAFESFLARPGFWALSTGTVLRASAYRAAGGWRRDLMMAPEIWLWLATCLHGRTVYCSQQLYGYRVHDAQMSNTKLKQGAREWVQIIKEACVAGEKRGLASSRLRNKALRRRLEERILSHWYLTEERIANGAPVSSTEIALTNKQTSAQIRATLSVAPLITLTSKAFWVCALRICLGERILQTLRSFRRRVRQRRGSQRVAVPSKT